MQRLNFAHSVPGKRRNSRRHFFCTDVAGSFCIFVRCFATRYTAKTRVYKSFFLCECAVGDARLKICFCAG